MKNVLVFRFQDLNYLTDRIPDDPFTRKYKKLNEALTDLVSNYSLVRFIPLSIKKKEMMMTVKNAVDQVRQILTNNFGSKLRLSRCVD